MSSGVVKKLERQHAVRITAVPRSAHPNSGLQALHFAAQYGDEVWALPAPGRYIGSYEHVQFSALDSEAVKSVLPMRVVRAAYLLLVLLRALLRRNTLFIVHSFTFAVPLWLLRKKYCIFIHGSDRRFLETSWGKPVARQATAIFGVGFGTQFDGIQVREIPNIFVPLPSDEDSERPWDVVFVLRNAAVKNPFYPLDLAKALGRELGLRIVVVGVAEDELPDERRVQLAELKARGIEIRYVGRQSYEAVVDWMRSSRVLIIPSLAEGLPKALLEGMAQGLHVVVNAPLVFSDEILARVERLDVYDWPALAKVISECRTRGRSKGNVLFAEEYLAQSRRILLDIYDRLYQGAYP